MEIEIIGVGLGIIVTLIGIGYKAGNAMQRIEVSIAEIKGILAANSARLDRIENEVKDIDNRVREMELK